MFCEPVYFRFQGSVQEPILYLDGKEILLPVNVQLFGSSYLGYLLERILRLILYASRQSARVT